MKNHETTLKNHGNQPKTMKNHETTLKNHGSDDFLLQTYRQTDTSPLYIYRRHHHPNIQEMPSVNEVFCWFDPLFPLQPNVGHALKVLAC